MDRMVVAVSLILGMFMVSPLRVDTQLQVDTGRDVEVPGEVASARDYVEESIFYRERLRAIARELRAPPWIVSLMRSSPRAARSWQLSPDVVVRLGDEEIVDFVLLRAEHIVSCTRVLWQRVQDMTEPSEAMLEFARETRARTVQGYDYFVGPDCVFLLDSAGEAVTIRTRDEVDRVMAYERAFVESQAERLPSEDQMEANNYEYNKSIFWDEISGWDTYLDRGFSRRFRRAVGDWPSSAQAYRFATHNVMFYFATGIHSEAQLVFLAPFAR